MAFIDYIKKFFSGFLKTKNTEYESLHLVNSGFDIEDKYSREAFLRECLEVILQHSEECNELTKEYEKITDLLADMDEIENLDGPLGEQMDVLARKIVALENETTAFRQRKRHLDEAEYNKIDAMADDIAEGIKKLEDEEAYRELVRRDLKRIKAEKEAYKIRRTEADKLKENLKGVAVVIVGAFAVCMVLLVVLRASMNYDITIGAYIAVIIAAIGETAVFLKYENTVRDIKKIRASYARLVTIQNTVKIRFVNNKNLLDYLYLKYKTQSAKSLKESYSKYLIEKEERTQFMENSTKISYYRQELTATLNQMRLKSPLRWITKEKALIDKSEMTELRHDAILRRQSLRAQIDENESIAKEAKAEIMEIATSYPEYAPEIYALVEEYETKTN